MDRTRAYVSHSIRGKHGPSATDEQRKDNSDKAIVFGNLLREEFPIIDFYIPGEHYEIDTISFRKGYMTEKQILDIDCEIISRCNFMIVYSPDDYVSRGMQIEIDHAVFSHIPIISAIDGSYTEYLQRIIDAVNCYLTSCMK
jgi:hypothetical protein